MDSVYTCPGCRHESPVHLAACPRCGRGPLAASAPASRWHPAEAQPESQAGARRVCYKCDFEGYDSQKTCPRCGGNRFLTASTVRGLGVVLLALGVLLVAGMSLLTVVIAGIIAHTDEPGATNRFTGTPRDAAIIFGIFGLVIAFGLASMAAGTVQVTTGRRNKPLTRLILGIAIALLVIGELVQLFL